MTPDTLLLLAAAAALAGAVNAAAGGGSLITFPALVWSGLGAVPANVTSTVAMWPSYAGAAAGYREDLPGRPYFGAGAPAAFAGGATGALLLLTTPSEIFDAIVPVLVVMASALLLLPPFPQAPDEPPPRFRPASLQVAMFLAGAYGGYFGGGLGIVLLAVLTRYLPGDLHQLNAAKVVLSLLINTVAVGAFAVAGPVEWRAVMVMLPAALLGAYLGARVTRRIPAVWLRRGVAGFGIMAGVLMWVQ